MGGVWPADQPDQAPSAGVTWNSQVEVVDVVWTYFSQSAYEDVDALSAYDAVVADTPGASWSVEFAGSGAVRSRRVV